MYSPSFSAHKRIPRVEENDKSNPVSPTEYGFGRVRISAAKPSELIPFALRDTSGEAYAVSATTAARITEGVKPVSATYESTNKAMIAKISFVFRVTRFKKNITAPTAIERCIPETTIKNELPVS